MTNKRMRLGDDFDESSIFQERKKSPIKINKNAKKITEDTIFEGQGISEDKSYNEEQKDSTEDFETLDAEIENKIKESIPSKTIYAHSTENKLNSVRDEADKSAGELMDDILNNMPADNEYVLEYDNQEHDYVGKVGQIDYIPNSYPVSFTESIKKFFKNYFNFKGYASRSEFWFAYLWIIIITFATSLFNIIGIGWVLTSIWLIACFIPYMSLFCRRYHDVGYNWKNGLLIFGIQSLGNISVILVGVLIGITFYMTGDISFINSADMTFGETEMAFSALLSLIVFCIMVFIMGSKSNSFIHKPLMNKVFLSGAIIVTLVQISASIIMMMNI